MADVQLTPQQSKTLFDALLDAFPSFAVLERMVRFGLNENLHAVAGVGDLNDIVFRLLAWAQAQGRLTDLVTEASKANPGNSKLQAWVQNHFLVNANTISSTDGDTPSGSSSGDHLTSVAASPIEATNVPTHSGPKVFISYSHDSLAHDQRVRTLADKFRSEVKSGSDSIAVLESLVTPDMAQQIDICRFETAEYLTKRGFPPFH